MASAHSAIALAAVLVLAGCSTTAPPQSSETPVRVSPAPVPTQTTTAPAAPPGYDPESGTLHDPDALADRHARAIAASFLVTATETVRTPNGSTLARFSMTLRINRSETTYLAVLNVSGPLAQRHFGSPPRIARYWPSDQTVHRLVTRGNATTGSTFPIHLQQGVGAVGSSTYWTYYVMPGGQPWTDVHELFSALRPPISERYPNATTRLVRHSTPNRHPALADAEHVSSLHNASIEAVVRPSGLVERYRLSYTATRDGTTIRVKRRLNFREVGHVVVERPLWVKQPANLSRGS